MNFHAYDDHINSIGICITTTNQSGWNFSLVVFGRRAYWNGIQLTKKRIAEEMNQKSNKGFVITTDVTSITYYSSNRFTQMSLNII